MHVCMISSGSDPIYPEQRGAVTPFIWALSKEFINNGHSVSIIGIGNGSITRGEFKVFTSTSNLLFSGLRKTMGSLPIYPPALLFDKYSFERIAQLQKQHAIDIIHINSPYSIINLGKLFFAVPVVCSIHNKLKITTMIQFCDKILTVSDYLKNFLIDKKHVRANKIKVLPVAINTSIYKPSLSSSEAKKRLGLSKSKILLFIGRKCPEKGPQVLIQALPRILRSHPNVIAIFIGPDYFFGSNSSRYTENLISIATKLNVKKNCLFLNFMSQEKLLLFLNAADIVTCPSIWQEPLGKVVLEALAFQKPVIASRVGGIPEIITNGTSGLLIAPDNPGVLADSVIFLLDHPETSLDLGREGRRRVINNYSFEVVAKRCLEIYRTI